MSQLDKEMAEQSEATEAEIHEYLNADTSVAEVPQSRGQKIKEMFSKELVGSPYKLMLTYGLLSVVGYLISLTICAQNSFGLTHLSHQVAGALHTVPGILCPILCGFVFTGIPFLFSAVFLNRFQQRYMLFKLWWFLASVPLVTTLVMLYLPARMRHNAVSDSDPASMFLTDIGWISIWAAAAILTPYILEGLIYLRIRQKKYAKI